MASTMTKTAMKVGTLSLYTGADGKVRVGAKGKVVIINDMLGGMSKGEARQFRKSLRSAGLSGLAGEPRFTEANKEARIDRFRTSLIKAGYIIVQSDYRDAA
jgi:hypothetical protein